MPNFVATLALCLLFCASGVALATNEQAQEIAQSSGGHAEHVLTPGTRQGPYAVTKEGEVRFGDRIIGQLDPQSSSALLVSSPAPTTAFRYVVLWDGDSGGGTSAFIADPKTNIVVVSNIVKRMHRVGSAISWSPGGRFAVIPTVGEVQQWVVLVDTEQSRTDLIEVGQLERDGCDLQSIEIDGAEWQSENSFQFAVKLEPNPWNERPCPTCAPCPDYEAHDQPTLIITADLLAKTVATSATKHIAGPSTGRQCPPAVIRNLTEDEAKALMFVLEQKYSGTGVFRSGCVEHLIALDKFPLRGQTVVQYQMFVNFPDGHRTECLNQTQDPNAEVHFGDFMQQLNCADGGLEPTTPGVSRIYTGKEMI